jgi:hypothetical protein
MSLFGWLEQIICNEEDDVIQLVLSICNEIWWIETRDEKTNRYHFQTVTSDGVFRLQDPTNLMLTLRALRRMENGASRR